MHCIKNFVVFITISVISALSIQTALLPLNSLLWNMASVSFAEIPPPPSVSEIEENSSKKISPICYSIPSNHAPLEGLMQVGNFSYKSALLDSPPVPPPDA